MCCHVPRFVANTMELLFFADATELPLVRTIMVPYVIWIDTST